MAVVLDDFHLVHHRLDDEQPPPGQRNGARKMRRATRRKQRLEHAEKTLNRVGNQ